MTQSKNFQVWFHTNVILRYNAAWNDTGVDLVAGDFKDRRDVQIQTLLDFFSTLEVANLKEGSITKLFEAGYTTIADIININENAIVEIIGSNGSKIHKSLHDKLNPIDPWVLYGAHPAFGRGVGTRKFKALFDALGADADSKKLTYAMIMSVEGFQDKTATKIVGGLSEFNDFLGDIYGSYSLAKPKSKGGAFDGLKICFTGFRDNALAEKIEQGGGENQSSVSSKTSILVTKEANSTSSKAKKARDNGTTVMSLEQFKAKYNV